MEKKKLNIGAAASSIGKTASELLGKAKKTVVSVVDQNDDGELNIKDVNVAVKSIGLATKNAAAAVKDSAEARSREKSLKSLSPIFTDDLDNADFSMPKLIRLTEIDKKRAENDVCAGSIGFLTVQKEMRIVNIFRNSADAFGISFYPDMDNEIYYVDPSDRDRYIALEDYFSYLKVARINELQKIAQDLGAKHFKVTYKEQRASQAVKKVKGQAKAPIKADFQHEFASNEFSTIEIAAEMTCIGHAPTKPKLTYLQREPSILSLIELRMDEASPITHQKYMLKLSNSSGIKESDAIKIDSALKSMKYTGSLSVVTEAQNEARRFFEYEIEF